MTVAIQLLRDWPSDAIFQENLADFLYKPINRTTHSVENTEYKTEKSMTQSILFSIFHFIAP